MKRTSLRILGGLLLIAVGILALLQTFGIISGSIALLWALLFGAGGAFFLFTFLVDRSNWWSIIPGFVLLAIGTIIALEEFAPGLADSWLGSLFLGGIGVAFWLIYLAKREHWWAVIPAGVLLTLALVAGLSSSLEGIETSGVFFLGLATTFGLVAFLPTPEGRMKWALVPAAVMLVMGLLLTAAAVELLETIWPVALILMGLYLVFRVIST